MIGSRSQPQRHRSDSFDLWQPVRTAPRLRRRAGRKYSALAAYAQSKLAEVVLCSELERRLPAAACIRCIAVHPGNVVVRALLCSMQLPGNWAVAAATGCTA